MFTKVQKKCRVHPGCILLQGLRHAFKTAKPKEFNAILLEQQEANERTSDSDKAIVQKPI